MPRTRVATRQESIPSPTHRGTSESLPPSSSVSSSPLSSPGDLPKRKSPPLDPPEAPIAPPRAVKRLRAAWKKEKTTKRKPSKSSIKTTSRASSRPSTRPPSPEPLFRSSASRSTSEFPLYDDECVTPRRAQQRVWYTQEHGIPGDEHLSSEMVVKRLMKSYKAFFKNPRDPTDTSFDPHPENYPFLELEYPNSGAAERFILLAPKDKDHYNPVLDLERTLYTIVEFYVPKEHQPMFGPIPPDSPPDDVSPPSSPSPSPPCSPASYSSPSSSRSRSPESDDDADGVLDPSSPLDITQLPLLLAVQRAINLKDGPLFMKVMERVNHLLHTLKYPRQPDDPFSTNIPTNPLMGTAESWSNTEEGLPYKVLMRIIEENYQRTVGPNVPKLKKYEAFSSTVYGELMPSLVYEILNLTDLKEDSIFLDLGSGVANIVVQASLQTGCKSYGIELMPTPARVAEDTTTQMRIRCRMWGVRVGEMELEKGDMLKSKRVDQLIPQADVVLVDNKVFEESLNERLRPKFLDLKEGAKVVSLAPFVPGVNARMTKRNVDDISAIFDVKERFYHSGSVSWGNNGGNYFIHTVDRAGYAKIKERFDTTHTRSSRSSRSRK